jgi:predicted nucleic acid-binding protein
VAGELLLDTGAFVSILDRTQSKHVECKKFFEHWDGIIVTTEAVLTETSHLLKNIPNGVATCIDFVLRGGAILVPATQGALRRINELVRKYGDLPMDYADATLVALAEELSTNMVFTLDRTDFEIYRISSRRRFKIFP